MTCAGLIRNRAGGYRAGVADVEIPESMLTLQRAFDAAHAAVVALPDDADPAELGRLRAERVKAVKELFAARQGTQWWAWSEKRRIQEAAE